MNELYTSKMTADGCFACINSGKGFLCRFDELFADMRCTYVIKGGPGTGKSGLMNHIAAAAEARGETVTRIFCSSDPDSLDGVILQNRKIALADGTSPHTLEPKIPGVSGELLNLGVFWNSAKLFERKSEIKEFSRKKALLYSNAFSLLSSAGGIAECRLQILSPHINERALEQEIANILPVREASPEIRFFQTSCLGMKGAIRLETLRKRAEKTVFVRPFCGNEYLFLEKLKQYAEKTGISFLYSLDPVSLLPDSLLFTKERLLVCPERTNETADLYIDPRTVLCDIGKAEEERLRRYGLEERQLTGLALSALSALSEYHFSLESIYGSAMDFSRVEEFKRELEHRIFS